MADDHNASSMASALRALSPGPDSAQAIEPGAPMRLSVDDARDIPSIVTDYTGQVPIILASSGIRRIVALAYMLTWTWSEHRIASELRGDEPSRKLVMLFDEVESHLHPRWQRSILRALRDLGSVLRGDVTLQLVVLTHSPLVLASMDGTPGMQTGNRSGGPAGRRRVSRTTAPRTRIGAPSRSCASPATP